MRKEIIIFSIFSVILAVILTLVMIYNEKLFKQKQSDKKKSLNSGYGFYSDPITLPCNSNDGKCTSIATQKTIFKCLPHPSTGKGCIDDKGTMTYNSKIVENPCQLQCVSNLFDVDDAIEKNTFIGPGGEQIIIPKANGCNKIINSLTGIEETNFFLGDFDVVNNNYPLKNCIPDKYQGYYEKTFTCNQYDPTGENNCRYACGEEGTLRLTGIYDQKLSKDILKYYPTELDEEGNIRHVCYDINNINQIEILNSTKKVPENFYYPNVCYKHVNDKKINSLETLYPVGDNNIFYINPSYNNLTDKIFIEEADDEINFLPNILNTDYDYYYDYNNYIKVQLGEELALVKKIQKTNNLPIIFDLGQDSKYYLSNKNIFLYLPYDKESNDNIKYYAVLGGEQPDPLVNFVDQYYTTEVNGETFNYRAAKIDWSKDSSTSFFRGGISSANVEFIKTSTNITISAFADPNNELQADDFIFYYGTQTGYNPGRMVQITASGPSVAFVDGRMVNQQEKITWRKLNAAQGSLTQVFFKTNSGNAKEININNIPITNAYVISNATINRGNRQLELVRDTSTLQNYTNDAFLLYGQESNSKQIGFYYPLYLTEFTLSGNSYTSQGTKIFTTSQTKAITDTSYIDVSDLQNKAFFITSVINEKTVYNYPVYINSFDDNTNLLTNDNYSGTSFYIAGKPESVATPPEPYLNYLDFNQYQSLALRYLVPGQEYVYPVFLSQNIENSHKHSFEGYFNKDNTNIDFYMPDNVITTNHALAEAPSKDFKLTDFKDIYSVGTVNVDYQFGLSFNNFISNYNVVPRNIVLPDYQYPGPDFAQSGLMIKDTNIIAELPIYFSSAFYSSGTYNMTLMRNNDYFLNNIITKDSNIAEKSRVYNKMISSQKRDSSDVTGTLIINPEKKVTVEADYTVFRSPNIYNPDGTVDSICYDNFNKPLPSGTVKILPTNAKFTVNKPCSNFNTDIPFVCGSFGDIEGNPIIRQRNEDNIRLDDNIETFDLGDYNNENGYMDQGLSISTGELVYCLKEQNKPYNSKDTTKCYPPYYTQEAEDNKIYDVDEEVFLTRFKRDYYLSVTNDNQNTPLDPVFWRRIFISEPGTEVVNYQTFLYKDITQNIFEIEQSGVVGVEPTQFAIQPAYRKNLIPYFDRREIDLQIPEYYPWNSYALAKNLELLYLPVVESGREVYNNIGVSFLSNNASSFKNISGTSIISQQFSFSYQDSTVQEIGLEKGDIFQTDFSFFNNFLMTSTNIYNNNNIIYNNNTQLAFMFDFLVDNNNNNPSYTNNFVKEITYTSIKPSLKPGDYLYVFPLGDNTNRLGDYLKFFSDFQTYVINNNILYTNMINPCFEIILVEKIDTKNKKITIKPNILNKNTYNYFRTEYSGKSSYYGAFPLSKELLNLNFPIVNIEDDKLFFDLTLDIFNILFTEIIETPVAFNRSVGLLFTPYITANYIKKIRQTPSFALKDSSGLNVYLTKTPSRNRAISALLDIKVIDINNIYINEVRNKRYTADDDFLTTFSVGDTINLSYGNFSKDLIIKDTGIVSGDKQYDYLATSIDNVFTSNIYESLGEAYSNTGTNNQDVYLPYAYRSDDSTTTDLYLVRVISGPFADPDNVVIEIFGSGTPETLTVPIENITLFPYEDFRSNLNITTPIPTPNATVTVYNNLVSVQKQLEEGNNIAYLKLKATTFRNNIGNTIDITDIKTLGVPEGIRYLDKSDINNGNDDIYVLNRSGKGSISSFDYDDRQTNISSNNLNDLFVSPSGFVLAITQKDIASYQFITGDISSKNSIVPYLDTDEYSVNNVVEYVNPNQRIYYSNNKDKPSAFSENEWTIRSDSMYTVDKVIEFVPEENYFKDTVVSYDNTLWTALSTNYNNIPAIGSSFWQEKILTVNDLQTDINQDYYTITNNQNSISNLELIKFKDENISNYPLLIKNYTNQDIYAPEPYFKMKNEAIDFSGSFINALPNANTLADIMGQAFITNNGDKHLSLPAVPYNKNNYTNADFLKDLEDRAGSDNISQYIYQIPIVDALDEGKPFCTEQYDNGVSNIIMSNSIIFFMLPVGLDNQDYPKFDVSSDGMVLNRNGHSYQNLENTGMSLIAYKDGNPVFTDITFTDTTNIIEQSDKNFTVNETIPLTKIGGGSSVNALVTKVGYRPIKENITAPGMSYSLGDIWYFTDVNKNITAHGYLQPKPDTSLGASSFISYQTDFGSCYHYNGLSIISEKGNNFSYDFTKNDGPDIISLELTNPDNFTAGEYSYPGLSIKIAERSSGVPLQLYEYLIGTSTPGNQLTGGTSAYQIFHTDRFKCRMYGLFGNSYFAKIGYQLKDKLLNDNNELAPGFIFSHLSNNIYSNSKFPSFLTGENESEPDELDNIYDVFTLQTLDGTSANTVLLTNNYDKPVYNLNSIPLPLAYDVTNKLSGFNIVNTTNLHDLFSVSAKEMTNNYFGPIQTAIPILGDEPDNTTMIFSNIRQNRNKNFINSKYDCSFYFQSLDDINQFPTGSAITFSYNNKNYYYSIGQGEKLLLSTNNTIQIKSNNDYNINLMDNTLNDHIFVLSLSEGSNFEKDIIKDNTIKLGDYELTIRYQIDDSIFSYQEYITYYDTATEERKINIVYDTKLNDFSDSPINIYFGFLTGENKTFSREGTLSIINN